MSKLKAESNFLKLNEKIMLVPTLSTRSYFIGTITGIEYGENLGKDERIITVTDSVRNIDKPTNLSLIYVEGNTYLETNDRFRYNILKDIDNPEKINLLLRKIVLLSDKVSEKDNIINIIKEDIFKIPDSYKKDENGRFLSYDDSTTNEMMKKWAKIYKKIDLLNSLPFYMTRSGEII